MSRKNFKPREPTIEERISWIASASEKEAPREEDLEVLRDHCRRMSPIRWARFKSDYRHFGKILAKLEMNPEDARWLL